MVLGQFQASKFVTGSTQLQKVNQIYYVLWDAVGILLTCMLIKINAQLPIQRGWSVLLFWNPDVCAIIGILLLKLLCLNLVIFDL